MAIRTKVIELDADWLLVAFEGPKPPANKRAFWLNRTLTDWLGSHPGRIVMRTLPIQHNGELLAVHVWLDSVAALNRPLPIKVPKEVADNVHKEHLEAFLEQAYQTFFKQSPVTSLAVVNRSGLAAVFDRAAEEIRLTRVDDLAADERTKSQIKGWLATPTGNCLAVPLVPNADAQ